jgi:Ca2+-binding EF-hand superfamily protein
MTRKTLTLMLMSMFGAAALSGTAVAKDDGHFKMMDSNNDGKITATEHAAGATKMFTGMDTDKDGFVTAAEMDAYSSKMWKDKGDKMAGKEGKAAGHDHMMSSADKIATMDTDGDGKLSAAEHDAGAAKMFGEMDANSDGNITRAEMEAGMKMKMQDHAGMDHMDKADKPADKSTTPPTAASTPTDGDK